MWRDILQEKSLSSQRKTWRPKHRMSRLDDRLHDFRPFTYKYLTPIHKIPGLEALKICPMKRLVVLKTKCTTLSHRFRFNAAVAAAGVNAISFSNPATNMASSRSKLKFKRSQLLDLMRNKPRHWVKSVSDSSASAGFGDKANRRTIKLLAIAKLTRESTQVRLANCDVQRR